MRSHPTSRARYLGLFLIVALAMSVTRSGEGGRSATVSADVGGTRERQHGGARHVAVGDGDRPG